jgi:hypothetical protein
MPPTWSYRRERTLVVSTSEDVTASRSTTAQSAAPRSTVAQSTVPRNALSDTYAESGLADNRGLFARGPLESSHDFEQRLRECLEHPSLLQTLAHAILRCEPEWDDRTTLRRLRLVAARLRRGGSLTLSYYTPHEGPADVAFVTRLERLVRFVSKALVAHQLSVCVAAEAHLTETPAPLAAAWHRLQRTRQTTDSSPRQATVQRRCITAHVAEQITYTLESHPSPATLVHASPESASPSLVAPVVFPTIAPRR